VECESQIWRRYHTIYHPRIPVGHRRNQTTSCVYEWRTRRNHLDEGEVILAIDPGLSGTGWAYWREDQEHQGDAPYAVGVITVPNKLRSDDFVIRAKYVAQQLFSITGKLYDIDESPTDIVVCEFPNYQDSGARSMGWRSGDLQRLTFLTGVIAQRFDDCEFVPVEPYKWKGQLPKHVVEDRIRKRLGGKTCRTLGVKSHAWDAIGIGLWYRDGGRP
jgi:hypothetical protein